MNGDDSEALANNSTIFVAPQGINDGWANTSNEDVTFVQDMLNQFESSLCIDPSEIFSMGFSYGGSMTYALACALPTVFRAVAVYSGANYNNGTLIDLWQCNGGGNQQWKAQNGELVNPASGKCLDDPNFNTANGTQLDLWACNGGSNQNWHLPS